MSDSEQRTVYLLVVAALRALERRLKHVLGAAAADDIAILVDQVFQLGHHQRQLLLH